MFKHRGHQSGFTLVELLIVIVVIAILAAITVIAFQGFQARAIDAQQTSDVSNNLKKVKAFHAEYGRWPAHTEVTSSALNQDYKLKLSDKTKYIKDPKAGMHNHTNYVLCYYVGPTVPGYIWPSESTADGIIISYSSLNGKHFAASINNLSPIDITDSFNTALTNDSYATGCQVAATVLNVRAGSQANLYPSL